MYVPVVQEVFKCIHDTYKYIYEDNAFVRERQDVFAWFDSP